MVETLNGMGIDITIEQLREEAGVGVIGRPHFAAILVRANCLSKGHSGVRPLLIERLPLGPRRLAGQYELTAWLEAATEYSRWVMSA